MGHQGETALNSRLHRALDPIMIAAMMKGMIAQEMQQKPQQQSSLFVRAVIKKYNNKIGLKTELRIAGKAEQRTKHLVSETHTPPEHFRRLQQAWKLEVLVSAHGQTHIYTYQYGLSSKSC